MDNNPVKGPTWLSLTCLMCRPLEACCFTSNSPPWATEEVRLVDIIYTFSSHMFSFSHPSLYVCSLFFFFLGGVTLLLMVEGVPSAVPCDSASSLLSMLDCYASCPSLLSSGIFLKATVPRPMRKAIFCIVIVIESVLSAHWPQSRRKRKCSYKTPCHSLILTEIRDKVRPFTAQYGTHNFVSKYLTIPFFKGRLATLAQTDHLQLVTTGVQAVRALPHGRNLWYGRYGHVHTTFGMTQNCPHHFFTNRVYIK